MRVFTIIALAVAIGLATAASPWASTSPDGLTRVSADKGFAERGQTRDDSPISGYAFPGVGDEHVAKGLAGFTGTLVVFGAGFGVAALSRRRRVLA